MKLATHSLYIDDSGTKEYSYVDGEGYDNGRTRYFVFAGVLIPMQSARTLIQNIKQIKADCFGTADVEIKSTWLRNPQKRQQKYLDEYFISDDELDEMVEAVYDLIDIADLEFIAAVVDKEQMRDRYGEEAWYPPAVAYDMILQRAHLAMADIDGTVRVVVDDMSGATPKKNQYKSNLKAQHARLVKNGSALRRGMDLSSVMPDVRFVDSAKNDLVQVADLVGYAVFRQFRDHGEAWDGTPDNTLPVYEYLARIAEKFRRGPKGRIQGYGIAKMPTIKRVHWGITHRGSEG